MNDQEWNLGNASQWWNDVFVKINKKPLNVKVSGFEMSQFSVSKSIYTTEKIHTSWTLFTYFLTYFYSLVSLSAKSQFVQIGLKAAVLPEYIFQQHC